MLKDAPLASCPKCASKDKFVFDIIFKKPFYTCTAPLPNSTVICRRSTEIRNTVPTTDIGRNVDALISQKMKNPSLTVESPYWKEQPTPAPQVTPSPTPQPTSQPEVTPSPTPQPTSQPEVTPSPTPQPTSQPEVTPSPTPQPETTEATAAPAAEDPSAPAA